MSGATSSQLFSLIGRTALVTGGNGGIGRAIALGLQDAGATVVVTGRNVQKNAAVAAELDSDDAVLTMDVRDEAAVEKTIAQVVERYGKLDILVNNAGLARRSTLLDHTLEEWDAVIGGNLTGSFLCARTAAWAMVAGGQGGKIINIGSMYSIFGPPNVPSYAASKTGVLGLTRALAVELGTYNIQVNAILPGWHKTDMTEHAWSSALGEQIRRKTPAGRWGTPQDLIGIAVFLASPASDFVTGAAIPVDGGYSVTDRILYD